MLPLVHDIIFSVLGAFISAVGGLAWLHQIEQILKLERFLCGAIGLLGAIVLIKDELSMNRGAEPIPAISCIKEGQSRVR
jgi:hypothetical protein